jgi:cytochrome oxidase assembly protein ShyY1
LHEARQYCHIMTQYNYRSTQQPQKKYNALLPNLRELHMFHKVNREFQFSWYITAPALVLILAMCRLSYWQWTRHVEKKALIAEMDQRLHLEPVEITPFAINDQVDWNKLIHRRLWIHGTYDFEHEMVLRNRRHKGQPGTFVLTPLRLHGTSRHILVSRGHLPLPESSKEQRSKYRGSKEVSFVGLVKESSRQHFLAPPDPATGQNKPWVEGWLRVDLDKMNAQLPYKLLPVYVELMPSANLEQILEDIVASKNDKNEILSLTSRSAAFTTSAVTNGLKQPQLSNPTPVNDLIIPPGRHLGYVFEWIALALLTVFIAFIIQTRKSNSHSL